MFGPPHQAKESIKSFGLERDWDAGSLQQSIARIELKIAKPIGRFDRTLIFL